MISVSRIAIIVSFLLPHIFFASEPVDPSINGILYRDIDQVWKDAPVTVKNWAEQLNDPSADLKSLPYRLFLHGIPGTGKTTMAHGIWKQNPADWELIVMTAGELISKHRGEAAEKFKAKVGHVKPNKKAFIIVDEAHVLMERHAEKSTDTNESTEVIKDFLDANANNRNCMVVFTGNNVTDMKDSMRSRIFRSMVEVPAPSADELHGMFRYHAAKEGFAYESIDSETLLQICKEGNIKVGRDVQAFAAVLKEHIRDNGYRGLLKKYALEKKYLLHVAGKVYKKKADNAGIGSRELSDREFQQKLHDDALKHQKELHNDAKKHQTGLTIGSAVGGGVFGAGLTKAALSMTAAKTGAAGVGATTVAVAGAGTTTTGGAAVGTVASTGVVAKLAVIGKGAMAAATAHPVVLGGVVVGFIVSGVFYYVCSDNNTRVPNKSGATDTGNV